MSQESVGNTVGASNNVNRNATNLNLQDVIREMDRLLQQRLRPMEERIEQLEEICLEGQLSQRRHNSECAEEYDGEIDDEQAYERATRQGLRQQELGTKGLAQEWMIISITSRSTFHHSKEKPIPRLT
ncbi:hypothetical protein V6N11_051676 [Hibiscus sabdariffa]|uniref:Uncharacterized protein n=1 Tax=Hibiscus sabdariffa TaxID=183260 RepID=A0ABR2U7S5_9ROSI